VLVSVSMVSIASVICRKASRKSTKKCAQTTFLC
jgi:hypothetical protein